MQQYFEQMIRHIEDKVIHRPGLNLTADTALVSTGLIDSFALVDLLMELEDITGMRIPAGKVSPKDMDTVRLMFDTAQRVGKAHKVR